MLDTLLGIFGLLVMLVACAWLLSKLLTWSIDTFGEDA